MKKRRRLTVARKVRDMVRVFGGKRATVRVMGAASPSSLKRWMNRECRPVKAHMLLVDNTYGLSRKMGKELGRILGLSKLDYAPLEKKASEYSARKISTYVLLGALLIRPLRFSRIQKLLGFSSVQTERLLEYLRKEFFIIPRAVPVKDGRILAEYELTQRGKALVTNNKRNNRLK